MKKLLVLTSSCPKPNFQKLSDKQSVFEKLWKNYIRFEYLLLLDSLDEDVKYFADFIKTYNHYMLECFFNFLDENDLTGYNEACLINSNYSNGSLIEQSNVFELMNSTMHPLPLNTLLEFWKNPEVYSEKNDSVSYVSCELFKRNGDYILIDISLLSNFDNAHNLSKVPPMISMALYSNLIHVSNMKNVALFTPYDLSKSFINRWIETYLKYYGHTIDGSAFPIIYDKNGNAINSTSFNLLQTIISDI